MEREAKLRLSMEEAAKIESAWGPPHETLLQRNYYFDTPRLKLRGLHSGLRLRHERLVARRGIPTAKRRGKRPDSLDRYWLTFKGPALGEGALISRIENETSLDAAGAQGILESLGDGQAVARMIGAIVPSIILRDIRAQGLRRLGQLINERRIFPIDLGIRSERSEAGGSPAGSSAHLEVDRILFPDETVEHELEVEWPASAGPFPETALRDRLARIGIAWRPESRSKLARLFERIDLLER